MIGNRGPFRNEPFSISLGSPSIIADLKKVFFLTRKELKWYLKSWFRKQNRNFDFKEWWAPPSIFSTWIPFGRKPIASTISQDLVPVEPMIASSGQLFYMDYQYTASIDPIETFTPRRNVASRYGRATINVNVDDESRGAAQILNDWRNLINEQIQHEQ